MCPHHHQVTNLGTERVADFAAALQQAYVANPCQVLPNALWKTMAELERLQMRVDRGQRGAVEGFEAFDDNRLVIHWRKNRRESSPNTSDRLSSVSWALLHQDYMNPETTARFRRQQPYFRMIHRGRAEPSRLPADYVFTEASAEQAPAIAEFIAACYPDLRPGQDAIRQWALRTVYAPDLWVWVMERPTGPACALAIAECDRSIGEVSMEWVQTRPGWRGRGIGKAVVLEILRRAQGRMNFATVSGRAGEGLEAFYRSCGFSGDDVWWVLSEPSS